MTSKKTNVHQGGVSHHQVADEDNVSDRQISTGADRKEIEQLAYQYWEKQGCPEGQDLENWLTAERAVRTGQRESLQ